MKDKKKETTTATYGYQTPTSDPRYAAATNEFNTLADTAFDTPDPSVPYQFGNMRNNVQNRFDNPFGADYSPEVKDAITYSQNNEIDQAQGQALREDKERRRTGKLSAKAMYASMIAPQLTQTGGTMTGTYSHAVGPALIGAAAQIGGAAIG